MFKFPQVSLDYNLAMFIFIFVLLFFVLVCVCVAHVRSCAHMF